MPSPSAPQLELLRRLHAANSSEEAHAIRLEALQLENEYRSLFARHRESWLVPELEDAHVSLVDVYAQRELFTRTPRFADDDLPRCFELGDARRPAGELAVAPSLDDFALNWECFTEGQLRFVNWNNIFAAGGAVAGCLAPLPDEVTSGTVSASRRKRRKHFHDVAYPGSDCDLFLYGLDEEEASSLRARERERGYA